MKKIIFVLALGFALGFAATTKKIHPLFGFGPHGEIISGSDGYLFFTNSSPYPTNGEALVSYRIPAVGGVNNNGIHIQTIHANDEHGGLFSVQKTNSSLFIVGTDTIPGLYAVQTMTDQKTARLVIVARSQTPVDLNPTANDGQTPFVFGASRRHNGGSLMSVNNISVNGLSPARVADIAWDGTLWLASGKLASGSSTNTLPRTNGLPGQVITTDGRGNLFWKTP